MADVTFPTGVAISPASQDRVLISDYDDNHVIKDLSMEAVKDYIDSQLDPIKEALLTTQGDIITRGVSIVERLAAVAAGQVLKSAGVGATPAWGVPSLEHVQKAIGTITVSATGTQDINVGFKAAILVFVSTNSTSTPVAFGVGFDDGTNHYCAALTQNAGSLVTSSTKSSIICPSVANSIESYVSALLGTGFTLSSELVIGSVTGTIKYLCLG